MQHNENPAVSSTTSAGNIDVSSVQILKERIRQASWSFNLAIACTASNTILGIAIMGLLLAGKVSEAKFTAIGGITSNIVGVFGLKLSKEANDRLDRWIAKNSKDVQGKSYE